MKNFNDLHFAYVSNKESQILNKFSLNSLLANAAEFFATIFEPIVATIVFVRRLAQAAGVNTRSSRSSAIFFIAVIFTIIIITASPAISYTSAVVTTKFI